MSAVKESRKAIKRQVQAAFAGKDKIEALKAIYLIANDDSLWIDPDDEEEVIDENDDDDDDDDDDEEGGVFDKLLGLLPDDEEG
jgi:hypothetical protein